MDFALTDKKYLVFDKCFKMEDTHLYLNKKGKIVRFDIQSQKFKMLTIDYGSESYFDSSSCHFNFPESHYFTIGQNLYIMMNQIANMGSSIKMWVYYSR